MTSSISLRLDDALYEAMQKKARRLNLSQTDYIRKAIVLLNQTTEKKERRERLRKASLRVRKESMKINKEFSDIEHDPND